MELEQITKITAALDKANVPQNDRIAGVLTAGEYKFLTDGRKRKLRKYAKKLKRWVWKYHGQQTRLF